MKIDFSGMVAMLIGQVANFTRDEQRAIAMPFAKDFVDAVGTNL